MKLFDFQESNGVKDKKNSGQVVLILSHRVGDKAKQRPNNSNLQQLNHSHLLFSPRKLMD